MRELLPLFANPAHYAGGEDGICLKNPANLDLRVALAFPDAYEVGMSYLGQKILYGLVNARPRWQAERVMAPTKETAAILRQKGAPLATLETDTPLANLDAIGFSITHELCYTDVLHILDLAGIPLRHADRSENLDECPLIMAGGGAVLGAEPLMPFIDIAALGDGEETLPDILELLCKAKSAGWSRSEFLREARFIPGVYVPSLFRADGGAGGLEPLYDGYRPARRIVADMNDAPYPVSQVTPVGAVHNRLALEIARGCTRGCRFCHAGMIYRPARERGLEDLDELLNSCLDATGFEEISFLSLSCGDYTALRHLYENIQPRCAREQITLSLPSLRVGSIDDSIMAGMASLRRAGVTIAPEAGSQRLRDVINKGVTEAEIILHAQKLLEHGWRNVKLYFMIGLPTETDEDIAAIADLCRKARDAGGRGAPRLAVTAALSPFVPKPFTPFQWEAQIDMEEISRRVNLARELFKSQKNIKLRWHDPAVSHLEGILSRAGREMAAVVEKAYRKGAIFCGWTEHFDLAPWLEAMAECGLNPADYIAARDPRRKLPWDHIEAGIRRGFLLAERKRAYTGKITPDCRYNTCRHCGACDTKAGTSLLGRPAAETRPYKNRMVFPARDQAAHQPARDDSGKIILQNQKQQPPRIAEGLKIRAAICRVWHVKTGAAAFLSNLDLQAAIFRAARRAGLPLAFSAGFHPLPLISFGRALSVGVASQMEWFSATLHSPMSGAEIRERLNSRISPDLAVVNVEMVDKKSATEQSISETFRLEIKNPASLARTAARFALFAESEQWEFARQGKNGLKTENIRPYLLNWNLAEKAIIFSTNWQNGYLSPLRLALAILGKEDAEALAGITLTKRGQIFANGAEYFSPRGV